MKATQLLFLSLICSLPLASSHAVAGEAEVRIQTGQSLFNSGSYLNAARYFFSVYSGENPLQNQALALLTRSLVRAGYANTAVYFYIKALKSGSRDTIQQVLKDLPQMLEATGGDVLKNYILASTTEADYDSATRDHFFYFLGKDYLLKGDTAKALEALKRVSLNTSHLGASAASLRASSHALLGQHNEAQDYFKRCESLAGSTFGRSNSEEAFDLEMRCLAGRARVLYEIGKFDDADEVYDEVAKKSFVWTDILFEQAWNAYAKGDFNRALGKLVSYQSPALGFVFNPEIDVLRAQSFLGLCLYDDVNKIINDFNRNYYNIGLEMKNFIVSNQNNYPAFYELGLKALVTKLHTENSMNRALNRFVRGPYFTSLVHMEKSTRAEAARIQSQLGTKGGFGSFLTQVLGWRLRSLQLLGGLFVRNIMVDAYNDLLADFDKISFIKSDMLSHVKTRLSSRASVDENGNSKRGGSSVDRKDYQYFWSFNGEFWNDELGDYIFALDSECQR